MGAPLGPRHPEVRALRELLRRRRARDEAQRFVVEGPRLLAAALDHGCVPSRVYVGPDATAAARDVVERARAAGVEWRELGSGVAARTGDTVTPQDVFAVLPLRRAGLPELTDALASGLPAPLLVVAEIADPGNAGTLLRSAEAAGAQVFVLGTGSVDAYNPKVVRASAGALFGLRVVEGVDTVTVLETLGAAGVSRLGGAASGGSDPETLDLTGPVALVLGHETRGLAAGLPLDGLVTVPMAGAAESLNVAMAGTVVLFEAARQRRRAEAGR